MNSTLIKFIQTFGKVPIIKTVSGFIFKRTHNRYIETLQKQKEDAYHNFGIEALSRFDECMRINNFRYTLAFGSMLGAIRDHGFIKHDLDIDTFMWIEDFTPEIIKELQKFGFTWLYNYSINNDKYGREDTFSYKGVNIDVFYIYSKIDKYPYCCDFVHERGMRKHERLPRRIELPVSRESKLVDFETLKIHVPANAEEICKFRYGPNYMTPDPNWNWINEKNSIVEWRDKIVETKYTLNPTL